MSLQLSRRRAAAEATGLGVGPQAIAFSCRAGAQPPKRQAWGWGPRPLMNEY